MPIFCFKKIEAQIRLSELFKKRRAELGLDLKNIPFKNSPISPKYLEAIESENFSVLPKSKTYRLAYIRDYATALGLDSEQCVRQFPFDGGLDDITAFHPKNTIKFSPFSSWSILARNLFLGALVFTFIGYLGWQVKGILEPPKLFIYSPLDGYISKQTSTMVEGETEQGAKLVINGQDVDVNNQGRFSVKLDLVSGLNTLNISTAKKHGKTTKKTVYVIVKPDTFTLDNQNDLKNN
jgi:hypothetical protein